MGRVADGTAVVIGRPHLEAGGVADGAEVTGRHRLEEDGTQAVTGRHRPEVDGVEDGTQVVTGRHRPEAGADDSV
jgi:hypothetical protein